MTEINICLERLLVIEHILSPSLHNQYVLCYLHFIVKIGVEDCTVSLLSNLNIGIKIKFLFHGRFLYFSQNRID